MIPNSPNPYIGVDQIGGTPRAILHLFSPRTFSNQARRPLAYKLDNKFVPMAIDAIASRTSTQNTAKINALIQDPQIMQSVMVPTTNPDYMLNLQGLAHNWTFLLIVNNDKTGNNGITRAAADNLQLCYGYFVDEPINPHSHMGRLTPNPNATLIVTHRTMVNKNSFAGAYGTKHSLNTMADVDTIPTQTMAYLSSIPTVAMRPEDLFQNVAPIHQGNSVFIMHDESKMLANLGQSLDISSWLSMPRNNIKKVLDSIADTQSSMTNQAFQGGMVEFGQDGYDVLLEQNLRDGARDVDVGLPTNIIITMGYVLQRYNPAINRVDLPSQQMYATQDQSHGSARNAFSSMLASVVPAMMAEFVLAHISFQYDSYAEGGSGAFRIDAVAPMTAMAPGDIQNRVHQFTFKLRSEIFSILKLQRGDFNLNMNCDCTSVTHIVLNFYCDSIRSPEIFEVPTILGGFNNPLIGSASIADANSKELGGFISIVRGDDRDIPMGHYDASIYNNALSNYDNSVSYNQNSQPYDLFKDQSLPGNWQL